MKELNTGDQLEKKPVDHVASAAKAALGAIPFAGSLLVELTDYTIPNQRFERVINFARALEKRLEHLEQEQIRQKMGNEYFTDLLEESVHQAARALSSERREYIASLIANSLSVDDIEYLEAKHLLRLLGEINDIEVIWLRFYLYPTTGGDVEFRSKHEEILKPTMPSFASKQKELDKNTIQKSYKNHLTRLNLLEPIYSDFNTSGKGTKISRYEITSLGRLLLRYIGI